MNPIAELRRRLDNMLRLGTIAEVDHAGARCRVQSGSITSAWLPWFSLRAGTTKRWSLPSVGEQCIVFSPCGELAQGIALLGIYSTVNPAPGSAANLDRTTYPDGTVIEYDSIAKHLRAVLPEGGSGELIIPAGLDITGDIRHTGDYTQTGNQTITGNVQVSDDVTASGISLAGHKHGGVEVGDGSTGAPQ